MTRLFILAIVFIGCSDISLTEWVKPELEGHWKFVYAEKVEDTPFLKHYPNPHTPAQEEGPMEPPYIGPDLIFENDSVYQVYGNLEFITRSYYEIDSGYLHYIRPWINNTFPVEYTSDTLFIYKPLYEKEYAKEAYVKTAFNDSVVAILKREGTDYASLAGTWHLIREGHGNNDGSEPYVLDYKHDIPDSIEISREDFIEGLKNNKIIMISTDGKKRDYTFIHHWGNLYLTPGEWFKGEDPWIHYTRH